jgi:thioredoxin 1
MQKTIYIFFCFVLVSTLYSFKYASNNNLSKTGIVFFKGTWKEAIQKAKKENKKIFLYIGATWCGPCKKTKAKTFTNTKVGAYFNTNFINVSLDGEDGGDGTMLVEKFKLAFYPSLYFIDSIGSVLKAGVGYYNSREILQFAKEASK